VLGASEGRGPATAALTASRAMTGAPLQRQKQPGKPTASQKSLDAALKAQDFGAAFTVLNKEPVKSMLADIERLQQAEFDSLYTNLHDGVQQAKGSQSDEYKVGAALMLVRLVKSGPEVLSTSGPDPFEVTMATYAIFQQPSAAKQGFDHYLRINWGMRGIKKVFDLLNNANAAQASQGASPAAKPKPASQVHAFQQEFEMATYRAGVPISWATDRDLIRLVSNESGFDPNRSEDSGKSKAFGLFQMLPGTWASLLTEVPFKTADPYWQAVGGFRYIQAGYQNPSRALAFWNATVDRDASLAPSSLKGKASDWIAKGWSGY